MRVGHLIAVVLCFVSAAVAQDKWAIAESQIVRLAPRNFSQLPIKIIRDLERRGCAIPQPFFGKEPGNVIKGEFARKSQIDWAVLCSRGGRSSVLVFWNGSTRAVSQIAKSSDASYLQTVTGDGKIGFSRAIGVVGKDYIIDHYKAYGGRRPPPIIHQGINDAFVEKASVVLYFHRGKWLRLQGADYIAFG